jgi:hypothetical protein
LPCTGNSKDHCCYVNGKPCRFLEENTVEGRHWACGLRRELGDWDTVQADDRYKTHVEPHWIDGLDCKTWPNPALGQTCSTCGENK